MIKAYPNWDREVQHEDLLNLFFGALADDDARQTVKSQKYPKDIDEAVDHVVYYCETGRQPKANDEKWRHYSRWTEVDDSEKDGSSSDEDSQAARVGDKPKKGQSWQSKKLKLGNASSASEKQTGIPTQQVPTLAEIDQAKQIQELQEQVSKLTQRQTSGGNTRNARGGQTEWSTSAQSRRTSCSLYITQVLQMWSYGTYH